MTRSRSLVLVAAVSLLLQGTVTLAFAGDDDFDRVVRHIEREYNAKKRRVLPFGFEKIALRFGRPKGVKGFKVAIFDRLSGQEGNADLERVLAEIGPEWQAAVRVFNRAKREQTYVYMKPGEKRVELLVVSVEEIEAVVVKAAFDLEEFDEGESIDGWIGGIVDRNSADE